MRLRPTLFSLPKILWLIFFAVSAHNAFGSTVSEQSAGNIASNTQPNYYVAQADAISGVNISFTNAANGDSGRIVTYPYSDTVTVACSDTRVLFVVKSGTKYRASTSPRGSLGATTTYPDANGACVYKNDTDYYTSIDLTAGNTYAILFTNNYASSHQWYFYGADGDVFGGSGSKAGFLRYSGGYYYYESGGTNLADYAFRVCDGTTCDTSLFKPTFPLAGYTAYTAPISGVFDHSMTTGGNCPDNTVTAYTDEVGEQVYGQSGPVTDNGCGDLYGFMNDDEIPFSINGQYTSGELYLFYDGHTGFDYPTTNGTDVYPVADGTAYLMSEYNGIMVDHGNEYATYYLHLSSRNITDGQSVTTSTVIGETGSDHLHLTFKRDGTRVDPYGWEGDGSDPYTDAVNIKLWQ